MKEGLTIGELGRELNLNPKTIRYYEEIGIVPKVQRGESGYRLYCRSDIERLQLVKRAKLLGLSLEEIKNIVGYAIYGHCDILEDQLFTLVERKLGEIDQKLEELITFKENLVQYRKDLAQRVKTQARDEFKAGVSPTCQCIGEEVDSFRR